jgi:hypothetical protein
VVSAGGIPKFLGEIRYHCVQNPWIHRGCGIVVEINGEIQHGLIFNVAAKTAGLQIYLKPCLQKVFEPQLPIKFLYSQFVMARFARMIQWEKDQICPASFNFGRYVTH